MDINKIAQAVQILEFLDIYQKMAIGAHYVLGTSLLSRFKREGKRSRRCLSFQLRHFILESTIESSNTPRTSQKNNTPAASKKGVLKQPATSKQQPCVQAEMILPTVFCQ